MASPRCASVRLLGLPAFQLWKERKWDVRAKYLFHPPTQPSRLQPTTHKPACRPTTHLLCQGLLQSSHPSHLRRQLLLHRTLRLLRRMLALRQADRGGGRQDGLPCRRSHAGHACLDDLRAWQSMQPASPQAG